MPCCAMELLFASALLQYYLLKIFVFNVPFLNQTNPTFAETRYPLAISIIGTDEKGEIGGNFS